MDRAYFICVLAFRTKGGYNAVKGQYDAAPHSQGVPFPKMVPFIDDAPRLLEPELGILSVEQLQEELEDRWDGVREFLFDNLATNMDFWWAVRSSGIQSMSSLQLRPYD